MHRTNRSLLIPPVLLTLVLLAGCGAGGNAHRYYLIDPMQAEVLADTPRLQLAVEVIDVHIPQYLERFQIATRSGENRLFYSPSNQWGENLRKNLIRTLGRNLADLLATPEVATPLNRSAARPDVRVQLHIEQFEKGEDGHVRLAAHWQLTGGPEGGEPATFTAAYLDPEPVAPGDYDLLVSRMQQLYGRLCREIAGTIRTRAGGV